MSRASSLHVSPRGEVKCVRGPSGRGASRPRPQHVPLAFHETRNTALTVPLAVRHFFWSEPSRHPRFSRITKHDHESRLFFRVLRPSGGEKCSLVRRPATPSNGAPGKIRTSRTRKRSPRCRTRSFRSAWCCDEESHGKQKPRKSSQEGHGRRAGVHAARVRHAAAGGGSGELQGLEYSEVFRVSHGEAGEGLSQRRERSERARTDKGLTALHRAARDTSDPAVIEALLDAGANPRASSIAGRTPWYYARTNGKIKGSAAYQRLRMAIASEVKKVAKKADWSRMQAVPHNTERPW